MGKYKKELLFTLAVLAAAAGLWLATHAGRGTGNVAPTPSTCMWKTAASPL